MKRILSTSFYPVLLLLIIIACSGSDETTPYGSLIGYVELFDINGVKTDEFEGTTVQIADLENKTTITDASGRFELTEIPFGYHSVNISNSSYGSLDVNSVSITGGNIPNTIGRKTLYEQPSINLKNITFQYGGNGQATLSGDMNPQYAYLMSFYVNDSSNVSDKNYDYRSSYSVCCGYDEFLIEKVNASIYIPSGNFSQGQTVYIVVYFYNYYEEEQYDAQLGTWIRTSGVRETPVFDFRY